MRRTGDRVNWLAMTNTSKIRHTVNFIGLFTHRAQAGNTIVSGDGAAQTESIATVLVQGQSAALLLGHLLLHLCKFGRHD